MKVLYSMMMALLLLTGCQKEFEAELRTPDNPDEVTLSMNFGCSDMDVAELSSRSLSLPQESNVRDLNIYLFHKATGTSKRQYISGTTTHTLALIKGEYDIYAIANFGEDMGAKTQAQVENLHLTIFRESDLEQRSVLPMGGKTTINVSANMSIPVRLTRIAAKMEVSVTVAGAMASKIRLKSVRLASAPRRCSYFKPNVPLSDMMSYSERAIGNGMSVSFYMLENCQGQNISITDQRRKSQENAPTNATYLHIKAETDDELLDYYIYPGANNTTDFNVSRNRNHLITVNILGINQADWRVKVTNIPKDISVSIAHAEMTSLAYWPNLYYAGADYTMDMTVILSKPAKYDVSAYITGAFLYEGTYNETPANGFFQNPYVTVPAGATSATKRFSLKFRTGRDEVNMLFLSHCRIGHIIKNQGDVNSYPYNNEYVSVPNVNAEISGNAPND